MKNAKHKQILPAAIGGVLFLQSFFLQAEGGRFTVRDTDSGNTLLSGYTEAHAPEEDALLKKGIYFENRAELTKALEDFCS